MSDVLILNDIIAAQKKLDEKLLEVHQKQVNTKDFNRVKSVKLALLVELSEFANTTRCFKFWSFKGIMDKEIVLDEIADVIHFLTSITYLYGLDDLSFDIPAVPNTNLTELFLDCYREFTLLDEEQIKPIHVINCWTKFLKIISKLGYTSEDLVQAYFTKNKINYDRINQGY